MYKQKYFKYKSKYLKLKYKQHGGNLTLEHYYQKLVQLYNTYEEPLAQPDSIDLDYNDIFSGPFLSDKIKIDTNKLIKTKYDNLIFVSEKKHPNLIKYALIMSKFLNKQEQFIVIYLDSPEKKVLPKSNEIINRDNVNSGYSTSEFTVVFRKEEAPKVLIHELLHQFQVDCGYNCYKKSHEFNYYEDPTNKRHLLYNESLVETIATILNCMLVSIQLNSNYLDCIKREQEFILGQAKQIIEYLNITNIFEDKIIASASILEYYLMKAATLNNLDDFISFLQLTCKNDNLFIFNRKNDQKLYNKLISYVKDPNFINLLDKTPKNDGGSMRMTCVELSK